MPNGRNFELDHRPIYGFETFDRWMQQLKQQIPDRATHAAVVTALEEDGRHLDVKRLAAKQRLKREAVKLVRRLARFGDLGHPVHSFASVHVAQITAGSVLTGKEMSTFVLATRRGEKYDYWWADDCDGFGALGMRDEALTLAEAIVMVDMVVVAQASPDIVDESDRSGYLYTARMRVSSTFYPQLGAWFQRRSRRGRWRTDGESR